MSRIYLDYSATAPLHPDVASALRAHLEQPSGNPSSVHWAGEVVRAALRKARAQLARAIGATQGSVVFTSGGTEANARVLETVLGRRTLERDSARDELLLGSTEHASLLAARALLQERGIRVVELPVMPDGRVDPDAFEHHLGERTLLASVMWVNNETGVIQPIAELARRAARHCVPLHTDAVAALGRVELDLSETSVAYASFSAHKIGGPQGAGALFVAPGYALAPPLCGGGQEAGARAGTENVLGSVGFGAACARIEAELADAPRLRSLRDALCDELEKRIPRLHRNGSREHVVPHVLNLSFPGAAGEALVEALDLEGIAVSSGSACHAGSSEPSHVLSAMGLGPERSATALRISLGWATQARDLEALIERLPGIVARVREAAA